MMEETKKFEKEREALLSNPKNGYDRISEADLAAMESYCKESIPSCIIPRLW